MELKLKVQFVRLVSSAQMAVHDMLGFALCMQQ